MPNGKSTDPSLISAFPGILTRYFGLNVPNEIIGQGLGKGEDGP